MRNFNRKAVWLVHLHNVQIAVSASWEISLYRNDRLRRGTILLCCWVVLSWWGSSTGDSAVLGSTAMAWLSSPTSPIQKMNSHLLHLPVGSERRDVYLGKCKPSKWASCGFQIPYILGLKYWCRKKSWYLDNLFKKLSSSWEEKWLCRTLPMTGLHNSVMAFWGGAADLKLFFENPGLTRSSHPALKLLSAETMLHPFWIATTHRNSLMVISPGGYSFKQLVISNTVTFILAYGNHSPHTQSYG